MNMIEDCKPATQAPKKKKEFLTLLTKIQPDCFKHGQFHAINSCLKKFAVYGFFVSIIFLFFIFIDSIC